MKMRIIVTCWFLLFSLICSSQSYEEIKKVKALKNDTTKAKLLGNIGYDYGIQNPDSAFYYYDLSKKLSEKLKFYSMQIRCNVNIGQLHRQMGNYDESLKYDFMNVTLSKHHGTQLNLANSYANVSTTYHSLLKFDLCTKYDLKAQKIYEALGDKFELVGFYSNLSSTYNGRHLFQKSLEYGYKAFNLSEEGFGTQLDRAYLLSTMSISYIYLNQYGKAEQFADRSLKIAQKENDYYLQQNLLNNMIIIKLSQEKYKELLPIAQELENLKPNINLLEYDANVLLNFGVAYFYNGMELKAKQYALKALRISELNNLSVISKNSYELLAKIEVRSGNFTLADKYQAKKDSISEMQLNETVLENIQVLEQKYETQKKQNEILSLRAKNEKKSTLNYILIATIITLCVFALLAYRNFKNNQKLQSLEISELEKSKKLLSIDAVLKGQEDERSRIAKDLHDGLGGLLSGTKLSLTNMKENLILSAENAEQFDKSLQMLDSTIGDLRRISHNLMPESLIKYGLINALKDFCSNIQSSSSMDISFQHFGEYRTLDVVQETFIYRIIQELITNSTKHSKAKDILVQLSYGPTKILVVVEDNGIGYEHNDANTNSGNGLKNVAYRVQYLHGTIETISSQNNGTSNNIELHV